jgi:hypothetical protein
VNYLLAEAEAPIRHALERLVEKDVRLHPFVIIDKVGRPDIFIQFAMRMRDRALCFDVPALGIVLEETTPAVGAVLGVEAFLAVFQLTPDVRVLIHEEEDKSSGRGVPFLKWLTAG